MKSFILCLVLILVTAFPSLAQATNTPAANTNAVTANVVPAGQAPDEVMQKLSGLVHAGKYPEAQKSVDVFMILYPDDQRLPKMKELLEKRLASPLPSNTVPSVSPPANNAVQTNAVLEQLKGMDKVEYSALIELGRQAQQTTDLDEQKTSLQQFMGKSKIFLEKHPNELLIWQLRAASAISLSDPMVGYEAGQKLLASGMADNDPNMQRLLSQLNLKGWLDKQKAEGEQKKEDYIKTFLGTWNVSWSWSGKKGRRGKEEFVLVGSSIEGHEINNTGKKCSEPDLRGTILQSQEINWECYLPPLNPGELYYFRRVGWGSDDALNTGLLSEVQPSVAGEFTDQALQMKTFYPSGWQHVISYAAGNADTITIEIAGQDYNPKSDWTSKHPVILVFTKISGPHNQQVQPQ